MSQKPQSIEHDILKLQRNFQTYLHEQALKKQLIIRQKVKNIADFLEERGETPKYICLCCEGLFFHHSVLLATREELCTSVEHAANNGGRTKICQHLQLKTV